MKSEDEEENEDDSESKVKEESEDDDSDEDEEKEEIDPEDIINAHFEKVQRTKNRFRLALNDIMIHINGKDYILKKMTADVYYWY